jgi:hypothetical protein
VYILDCLNNIFPLHFFKLHIFQEKLQQQLEEAQRVAHEENQALQRQDDFSTLSTSLNRTWKFSFISIRLFPYRSWIQKLQDLERANCNKVEEVEASWSRRLEDSRQRWATEHANKEAEWATRVSELEAKNNADLGGLVQ